MLKFCSIQPGIILTFLVSVLLTACISEPVPVQNRFSISEYEEWQESGDNLEGQWIVIQSGTRRETIDNIDYRTTGYMREIIQIFQEEGVYYARSCLEAETISPVSVSGDDVSVVLNKIQLDFEKSSFTRMSGFASSADPDVSFSASAEAVKLNPLGTAMGSFPFYDGIDTVETATVDCFQEADLRVTGSFSFVSQYSDVELLSAVDFSGDGNTYRQTGYVYSKDGTADPVRQLTFVDGIKDVAPDPVVYPLNGQSFSINTSYKKADGFVTNIVLSQGANTIVNDTVNIDLSSAD